MELTRLALLCLAALATAQDPQNTSPARPGPPGTKYVCRRKNQFSERMSDLLFNISFVLLLLHISVYLCILIQYKFPLSCDTENKLKTVVKIPQPYMQLYNLNYAYLLDILKTLCWLSAMNKGQYSLYTKKKISASDTPP